MRAGMRKDCEVSAHCPPTTSHKAMTATDRDVAEYQKAIVLLSPDLRVPMWANRASAHNGGLVSACARGNTTCAGVHRMQGYDNGPKCLRFFLDDQLLECANKRSWHVSK